MGDSSSFCTPRALFFLYIFGCVARYSMLDVHRYADGVRRHKHSPGERSPTANKIKRNCLMDELNATGTSVCV